MTSNHAQDEMNALIALFNAGRYQECETRARAMTGILPGNGFAWMMLGSVIKLQGRLADALVPMQRAVQFWPANAEAHRNLGNLFYEFGRYAEAETCLRQALAIKPDAPETHNNLGNTLREQGRLAEAEASCRRALSIKPDFAMAHRSLVLTLQDLGREEESLASLQLALQGNPDDARLRLLQLMKTLPIAPQTTAESAAAPARFDLALDVLAAWLAAAPENSARFSEVAGLIQPFHLAYRDGNHAARLSRYGDLVAGNQATSPSLAPTIPPRKKIRLAVISNHFHNHSVWHIIIKGLLTHIDKERFEVLLYYVGQTEDGETALAKSMADAWRDNRSGASLQEWLAALAADRPDVILYPEIAMDPMTLRLAARRLAPLQAASWGHPVTTGLPTVDLYFSGELIEPEQAAAHYREQLVRLPGTGCCTAPVELVAEHFPELDALASRTGIAYVIAQRAIKFDPGHDMLYADIAAAVGDSTFILIDDPQLPWATARVRDRFARAFAARGLDPDKHLLTLPWISQGRFAALLDMCDVYLDCPSFSGYTTAWQAAHRGIPLVTMEGRFMRQRLAAGLLRKIGVTDTIATSVEEYIAVAARIGAESRDPALRAARREALRVAAAQADHDVDVVRAFERSLADALGALGRRYG